MTTEEQRIAIAEECGVQTYPNHDWEERDDRRYFICTFCNEQIGWSDYSKETGNYSSPCAGTTNDYPFDLNATHSAAMTLRIGQRYEYTRNLREIVSRDATPEMYDPDSKFLSDIYYYEATAAQRAEAFLKTVGRWKE